MMRPLRVTLLALTTLALLVGCLGPQEALNPRWFRPALPAVEPHEAAPDAPLLRLHRVTAAQHLGERIAWRVGDVEYGQHELLRWMEQPAAVVEQGLVEALFVSGQTRRSEGIDAPVLSVSVLRFEEQRRPEHRVEVELLASLRDGEGNALFSQRFAGSAPLDDGDPATLARQIGAVAGHQLDELTNAVVTALYRR